MQSSIHRLIFGDAGALNLEDQSIDLVVTSPPYPMIAMWDGMFTRQDPGIGRALRAANGPLAFARMHRLLDRVWAEIYRVLRPGGFACINIGDAVRTVDGHFQLYPNYARILTRCVDLGFSSLPAILWRKQTNTPNKSLGSGMLPAGAYVTLEHEFILVLRKGGKRRFTTAAERRNRARSTLFWEERNLWFSDVWWDLKGTGQRMIDSQARQRSGAFPFQLPYRLICMYSVQGDTVLDPFLGTGATMLAAAAAHRNSVGVELNRVLVPAIRRRLSPGATDTCNARLDKRITNHLKFVRMRTETHGPGALKYRNRPYGLPVMTRQEVDLSFDYLSRIRQVREDVFIAEYPECDGEPPAAA